MNTETQFNDESKDLPTFYASGWVGSPDVLKPKELPDKWKIEYELPYNDYGQAICYTRIDFDGKMWAGNFEYESQVNFCPITGKKAPVKIDKLFIEE